MDYLGQGRSWPEDCNDGEGLSELNLRYCGSTWVEQVIGFLEDVVVSGGQKAHLVGNSVGGHIAVFVAAQRPDLVESVTLLNATPVWGSNLPGWSGHLPAPTLPKLVGRYLFDRIRDLNTIETYLNVCYANPSAFDDDLLHQIRSCTTGNGGHAAFASILWSPPVTVDLTSQPKANFEDCLQAIQCDTFLVFGSDDPSCTPSIAKRMHELLSARTHACTQRYVELSHVGHCPNHEAPKAVAQLLRRWWRAEENRDISTLVKDTVVSEAWGDTTLQEKSYEMIPPRMSQRIANTSAR
jgi:pimeloyl-ACP methyl ester carboxylesterase